MVNPQSQTLSRRMFPRTPQVGADDLPRTSRLTDLRPPGGDGDLYDEPARVSFVVHLRDEQRFDSVDKLVAQIGRDVEATRAALA